MTVPAGAVPGTRLRVQLPPAQSATPAGPTSFPPQMQLQVAPAAPPPRAAPPPNPSPALKPLPPGWTRESRVAPSGERRYRYSSPGGGHHADTVDDAWRASRGEKKKSGQHGSTRKRGMPRSDLEPSASPWPHIAPPPARSCGPLTPFCSNLWQVSTQSSERQRLTGGWATGRGGRRGRWGVRCGRRPRRGAVPADSVTAAWLRHCASGCARCDRCVSAPLSVRERVFFRWACVRQSSVLGDCVSGGRVDVFSKACPG